MDERRYFTRDEVVIHNTYDDIWVIVNGVVYDLTKLFECRMKNNSINDNLRMLLAYAGKDISRYFDKNTRPIYRINQHGKNVPIFPPIDEKQSEESDFWWRDASNAIGHVTCLERRVRIMNTLTRKTIMMNVCEEDCMNVIKAKYKRNFNANADNYAWRKVNSISARILMDKTLTQNGFLYHENEALGLPPAIWLYYNL